VNIDLDTRKNNTFSRLLAKTVLVWALLGTQPALADSVGQQQTTKYFTPDTIQMLINRIQAGGTPGFATGDQVSYIIQFTPVANGSTIGAGGWITDYIPAGAQVIGAWFVQPDGFGGFTNIAPPSTAQMADGWGATGANTFNANWATTDATYVAACAPFTTCNARLAELYADTGIFYSTDPRTAVNTYPSTDGRVRADAPYGNGNGYHIMPTSAGCASAIDAAPLIRLLGGDCIHWTTHNYWDAAMTNAFGSVSVVNAGTLPAAPRATNFVVDATGRQPTPFNAGSPVAGPDSGYKLDYTGSVGPWQRIAYPGSTVGKTTNGKATAAGANVTPGTTTNVGWSLSASNPLPANTNAVRWAAGRISVGTLSYVKITLQLTQNPPSTGLVNNSEVFGGDASPEAVGTGNRDNPWLYAIPSVADNNSNLFVLKEVIGICSSAVLATAQACDPVTPSNGVVIPAQFVKLRYRLTYLNSGNANQTNVRLSDVLPYKTVAPTDLAINAGNLYVKSGPDIRSTTPGLSWNSAAAGAARGAVVAPTALVTTSQQTINFSPIASLPAGTGGVVEMDVVLGATAVTALGNLALVSNQATLSSTQLTTPVNSVASSSVTNVASLVASKTTSTPNVAPGGTATYTITIANVGNAAASTLVVNDFLPSDGGTLPAHGFTTNAGTIAQTIRINGVVQAGANNPAATYVTPAIVAPYTGLNQQQVTWTFPAALTIPAGQSMTITFSTTVGASVAASTTAYTNDVALTYNNTGAGAQNSSSRANNNAPVTVSIPLSVTKTVNCVYNTALTACNAYTGGPLPSNAKLRYKIHYQNTGLVAQTNVQICDQLVSTQVAPVFASAGSSITSPVIVAPTPAGAYTDTTAPNGPGAAATLTANGVTVCGNLTGAAGKITFSYPAIASLAAGASGDVYVDVATGNAANNTTLTNTVNLVSTGYPGGTGSVVSSSVRDNANLMVTKTTSTPSIGYNSPASYTLTITNSGNQNATNIKVYDELPYTGTVADAIRRFNYTATGAITGLTSVVPTAVAPPTLTGYTTNTNQQEVLWNFGAQTLAPGGVLTIPFTATPGTGLNPGSTSYANDAQVSYTSGTNTLYSGVTLQAPVTIPVVLSITKSIDCVYVAGVCTPGSYVAGSGIPTNAKVRYKIVYQNTGTSALTNVVVSDTLPTQTAAASVSNIVVVSGPAIGTITPASPGAGGATFAFATIASLAAGSGGTVTFDVQTNAAVGATVTNLGRIVATQDPNGVTSNVAATVPTNFSITKTIDCVYVAAVCTPGSFVSGAGIPVNAKLKYKIVYQNIGPFTMSNVVLSDTLPTQTAAASVSNIVVVSGPALTPTTPALGAIAAGGTFSFATIASLAAGTGGTVTFDVQTNAAAAATVTNLGKIVSTEDPTGVSSSVVANVTAMVVTKTIDCVYSGVTCTGGSYVAGTPIPPNAKIKYKITYSNPGAAVANVYICDQLPTQVAAFTSVSNFTSSAGLAAPTSPANAACGFAAPPPVNFSYAVIASLAAAAPAATVTYDVQTTATNGNTVSNTGKLASATQNTSSIVSASVPLPPGLLITKTASPASPATIAPGGTVTYTITITNNGNSATTSLQIYDLLPYSGAVADATKRLAFDGTFTPTFNYTNGAIAPGGGNPVAAISNPPTLTGYTTNTNQQQVLWDFGPGTYALPVNGTITITFRATVGSSMPLASYYNTVYGSFNSIAGPGTSSVITALISVTNPTPSLTFLKTVLVYSDPVNGTTSPKFIPGAIAAYTLTAINSGSGPVDNSTLINCTLVSCPFVITDPVPANTLMYLKDLGAPGSGPVLFTQGIPSSTLTYNPATDLRFSNDNGASWAAAPTFDATTGCDTTAPPITNIRITPKGTFVGNPTAPSPSFTLEFRVCVK